MQVATQKRRSERPYACMACLPIVWPIQLSTISLMASTEPIQRLSLATLLPLWDSILHWGNTGQPTTKKREWKWVWLSPRDTGNVSGLCWINTYLYGLPHFPNGESSSTGLLLRLKNTTDIIPDDNSKAKTVHRRPFERVRSVVEAEVVLLSQKGSSIFPTMRSFHEEEEEEEQISWSPNQFLN